MIITVHLKPRASKTEIISKEGSLWTIRVTAPPVDNEANVMLIKLIAKECGVPISSVRLKQGKSSKIKLIEICE
jgi:uncharacterized protein (TIGR00251 family)